MLLTLDRDITKQNICNGLSREDCDSVKEIVFMPGTRFLNTLRLSTRFCSLERVRFQCSMSDVPEQLFFGCRSLKEVELPEGLERIGDCCFYDCAGLEHIDLPEGLVEIGSEAFRGCSALSGVILPESLTSIGDAAFSGCSSLTSLSVPAGISSFGSGVFSHCSGLQEVTVADGAARITAYTFYRCRNLLKIILPESLKHIGDHAFEECCRLSGIDLPSGLKTLGEYAFRDCTDLLEINLPDGISTVGSWTFSGCTSLQRVKFPSGLQYIFDRAFRACPSLHEAELPSSLLSLGIGSFYPTVHLTIKSDRFICRDGSVWTADGTLYHVFTDSSICRIPDGVTRAAGSTLYLDGVEELQLPPSFLQYRGLTLDHTDSLERIRSDSPEAAALIWDSRVMLIDNSVPVWSCSTTVQVSLIRGFSWQMEHGEEVRPDRVDEFREAIRRSPLQYWRHPDCRQALLDYGMIPPDALDVLIENVKGNAELTAMLLEYRDRWFTQDQVDEIEDLKLSSLLGPDLSDGLLTVPAGEGIEYLLTLSRDEKESVKKIVLPYNILSLPADLFRRFPALEEVDFPNGIYDIPLRCFSGCTNLKRVHLPAGLRTIKQEAFKGCTSLQEIEIPDCVQVIRTGAFMDCTSLRKVTFPNSLVLLDDDAFSGCTSLTEAELPSALYVLGESVFENITNVTTDGKKFSSVDGCITSLGGCVIHHVHYGTGGICRIPEGVTKAYNNALYIGAATELQFPDSFTGYFSLRLYSTQKLRVVRTSSSSSDVVKCMVRNSYAFDQSCSRSLIADNMLVSSCSPEGQQALVSGYYLRLENGEPVDPAKADEFKRYFAGRAH